MEKYTPYHRQRLSVIPGLTCDRQIQPKRNSLPFDEWVAPDLKCICERGLWLHLKILLKTATAVLGQEGE